MVDKKTMRKPNVNHEGQDVLVADTQIDQGGSSGGNNGNISQYRHHTPNPDHVLELWSISGSTFKTLFESLRAVLNEANVVFTEKGLKLAAVDSKQMALIHLFLDAENFEFYQCTEKLLCGIDVDLVHRTMRSFTAGDLICFAIHKDERDALEIIFDNRAKGTYTSVKIPLITLPEYRIENTIEYDIPPAEIRSTEFKKICGEMWIVSTTLIEIEDVGDKINFTSKDGNLRRTVSVNVNRSEGSTEGNTDFPGHIAKGTYFLKFLKSFAKASNLSPIVKIYLQQNEPLICEYSVAGLGVLKFALASVPEEVSTTHDRSA